MNIIFTPAAILDLLYQIDELKEYDLGVSETLDGKLQLTIGDSIYEIDTENVSEVTVPEEVSESIEDINTEAYEDLVESDDFEMSDNDVVESGLIKEAVKSLLLGGAIRLATKLLK